MTTKPRTKEKIVEERYLVWMKGACRPFWDYYPSRERAKEEAEENDVFGTGYKIIPCTITYFPPTESKKKK